MTLGKKITELRRSAGMSQEELAERLDVSRQAISKWEMDQAQPQTEKLLALSDLFSVSTDRLLRNSEELRQEGRGAGRYFGTDGFRGEANITLTSMQAYRVGRFLGWYYSSPLSGAVHGGHRVRIVIGKDTRRSSYMLEYSIVAGITASGADAYMLHVTTTPSVSYVTRQEDFDCGVMITASHNPYTDNGIKVINRFGEKLDDRTAALIEDYIDGDLSPLGFPGDELPLATGEKIGRIIDHVAGRNRYIGYLISLASNSYRDLRIGIDCSNGAAWNIAPSVFGALGARLYIIGDTPDGLNINRDCGSTHIENLRQAVRAQKLDIGFAFDGDADRCIAVDGGGNVVDGDKIMYILAQRLRRRGMLADDTVVATVMSNSGFFKSLERAGMKCVQTAVGDRFVYERMQKDGYSIGGEQSGHIILRKYATTGDGILTAIMLTEEVCDRKTPLAELAAPVTLYPQYTVNIKVKDKDAVMTDRCVTEALNRVNALIGGNGRVLLRKSGTEPVIRVMTETEALGKCKEYANIVADAIKAGGYGIE